MIVCVKCGRQMRPKKNGVDFVETARLSNDDEFQPYKLWSGDLLDCQECGIEVIYTDQLQQPIAQRFQETFEKRIEGVEYKAKDWSRS